MASSRRALPVATLALRILSLLFLIASVVIIATAKVRADDTFFDEPDTTFKNVYAYRYIQKISHQTQLASLRATDRSNTPSPMKSLKVIDYISVDQ
jgi:hypothetical protein